MFCSLINLYDLRFKDALIAERLSSGLALVILMSLLLVLILLFLKICKISKNLSEESIKEFKINFSKVIENLRIN